MAGKFSHGFFICHRFGSNLGLWSIQKPCQKCFPGFCSPPSEVAVLFNLNLSRFSFLGQVIDLDLLFCTVFNSHWIHNMCIYSYALFLLIMNSFWFRWRCSIQSKSSNYLLKHTRHSIHLYLWPCPTSWNPTSCMREVIHWFSKCKESTIGIQKLPSCCIMLSYCRRLGNYSPNIGHPGTAQAVPQPWRTSS